MIGRLARTRLGLFAGRTRRGRPCGVRRRGHERRGLGDAHSQGDVWVRAAAQTGRGYQSPRRWLSREEWVAAKSSQSRQCPSGKTATQRGQPARRLTAVSTAARWRRGGGTEVLLGTVRVSMQRGGVRMTPATGAAGHVIMGISVAAGGIGAAERHTGLAPLARTPEGRARPAGSDRRVFSLLSY